MNERYKTPLVTKSAKSARRVGDKSVVGTICRRASLSLELRVKELRSGERREWWYCGWWTGM